MSGFPTRRIGRLAQQHDRARRTSGQTNAPSTPGLELGHGSYSAVGWSQNSAGTGLFFRYARESSPEMWATAAKAASFWAARRASRVLRTAAAVRLELFARPAFDDFFFGGRCIIFPMPSELSHHPARSTSAVPQQRGGDPLLTRKATAVVSGKAAAQANNSAVTAPVISVESRAPNTTVSF